MQGPDGSMMQIVQQHPSNQPMQNYTEEYLYDPSGQASIERYNTITTNFDFWINSVYDWRYLWKGGRSGRDQIPPVGDDPIGDSAGVQRAVRLRPQRPSDGDRL